MQKALVPIKVINPFAPLIDLPDNFPKKRRALPILLNFIEAITFYHQYQRTETVSQDTGEVYIQSTAEDIENGFKYLKHVLFRRSDELSGALRSFYENIKIIITENVTENNTEKITENNTEYNTAKFKVSDIRQHIKLTPRSIQVYLKALTEYGYVQITGGKQRQGYEYELLNGTSENELQQAIESHIEMVMERIERTEKVEKTSNAKRMRNKATSH
jgi:DNA primase